MTAVVQARQHLVPLADRAAWEHALSSVPHTWAHTWGHGNAFARADQETLLYVWERADATLVCPVAVRHGGGGPDVTTPYGFGGPATQGDCTGWRDDWRALAAAEGWVCGYLALNPVLPDPPDLLDDEPRTGPALYLLDLSLGAEALLVRMSASRRRQLRRWAQDPPPLVTDRDRLLDFVVSRSTPFFRERGAGSVYAFAPETWQRLLALPGLVAIGAEDGGAVVAAYLFGATPRCADYLFGFSAPGYEHLSAGLVWHAATQLAEAGVPVLDLGGGIRPGDGVATFKQRFGPDEVKLRSLREVYRPEQYGVLCAAAGADPADPDYFPPYRGPHVRDHDAYRRSAAFYDRIYNFKDYATVLRRLREAIAEHHPTARSLLDVGCGTGLALAELREHYEVEGTDLSADMLAVAHARCPDVPLHEADMSDLDLGRTFDVVVCLFSAIGYVVTPERLASAAAGFARHLAPGGLLLVEPWFTPDTYWSGHLTVNHVDDEDLKATWMYVAERDGDRSVFDIHYLIGTTSGVEHVRERHEMGLFTDHQYLQALTSAGLEVEHEAAGFFGRGLYRARKPVTDPATTAP